MIFLLLHRYAFVSSSFCGMSVVLPLVTVCLCCLYCHLLPCCACHLLLGYARVLTTPYGTFLCGHLLMCSRCTLLLYGRRRSPHACTSGRESSSAHGRTTPILRNCLCALASGHLRRRSRSSVYWEFRKLKYLLMGLCRELWQSWSYNVFFF